jgi:hypothetical protein
MHIRVDGVDALVLDELVECLEVADVASEQRVPRHVGDVLEAHWLGLAGERPDRDALHGGHTRREVVDRAEEPRTKMKTPFVALVYTKRSIGMATPLPRLR